MEPDDSYPIGWDYAWLATDAAGHIAIFTNAGIGPIPHAVLVDRRASDQAEMLTMALSERSDSQMLVALPRPDDFVAFARRGQFAYDWQDIHRKVALTHRYELSARPLAPVKVDELTREVAMLAGRVRFDSLRFADRPAIAPGDHVDIHHA